MDRAIELLDTLLRLHSPARIGDLAKHIGAPRSTLYAFVNRLTDAGIHESTGDEGSIYFGQTVHLYRWDAVVGVNVKCIPPDTPSQ